MNKKIYKTYRQLITILRNRGVMIKKGSVASRAIDILEKENYYNVVNGYKKLFIDSPATTATPELYKTGVTFDEIYALYLFDRDLRHIYLKYLLNAIQQGVLTPSTKKRLDELELTKNEIEVSILKEQMQKPLLSREQLTYWICRFKATDINNQEQKQRLIDIFINSVYLYDDHAVITFNYKDRTKTVSLQLSR